MQISNLSFTSWINNRLPEQLWACLVIHVLPRDDALAIFRKIADFGFNCRGKEQFTHHWDLSHSQLTALPDDVFLTIIKIVLEHPLGSVALRPLLLIESLPNQERWKKTLSMETQSGDWQILANAVASTLNHQSQNSTDIRWLNILFKIALGIIKTLNTDKMIEAMKAIINYPNQGDMRAVRPTIRAMEMGLSSLGTNKNWSDAFWLECLKKTECIPSPIKNAKDPKNDQNLIFNKINTAHLKLLEHWFDTRSTTDVDARHDTVFGFGFYALGLLRELLIGKNSQAIIGRLVLKTLTDCRISLAYLLSEDSDELWLRFRKFGIGQAKLALLKFEEIEGEIPTFLNEEILVQIANEDIYQEYVSIDLGHWCGSDLRKMAISTGTKNDYDKYYGWTSTYAHGHWSAMRETCFTTCFNPLHRLHRVPRLTLRYMEDTIPDAILLTNSILEDINKKYPNLLASV